MFNDDEEKCTEEGDHEPDEEPDVDHLEVGGLREAGGDLLVEGVHHQHRGDRHGKACLKVLLLEIQGCL